LTLFLTLIVGCDTSSSVDSGDYAGVPVSSISVEPAEITLSTGPDGGDPQQFTAYVTYETGQTEVIPWVDWSVSNWSAGEVSEDGVFTPSSINGGTTWVTANLAGVEGQSTVTVVFEDQVFEQDVDDSLFTGDGAAPASDPWLYPEDGVNVPRNTPSLLFQWEDTAESYELRFRSSITDIAIYTTNDSWEAATETWPVMASTNAGGTLELTLSGVTDGSLWTAEPIDIQVNRLDAQGSIIYWTTSQEGLKEIVYGEEAENFFTRYEADGHCIGCHVISSKGMVAITYDGGDQELGMTDFAGDEPETVLGLGEGFYGNFKAFSPDGQYLLASYMGALLLYDGQTGEYLNEVSVGSDDVTHVDWSPEGDQIVIVQAERQPSAAGHFTEGRIAVADHVGDGAFDEPVVLYAPDDASRNAYYPAFSPDGAWIAFNQSYGDAYDDYDAELYVMPREGGEPIRLDRANQGDDLSNSWPKWGPLPDDDILWLAFASRRAYGAITDGTQPQIWLSAFDPAKAAAGEDPSFPAFWLPSQEPDENNHLPVWVE